MTHPAVSNGSYDVAKIRADFPALAMQVYGKPLVYLDNAASAQKPKAVLDRIQKAYTEQYANVHRGLHYLANEATEAYEGARETVRAFLNAEPPGRDHLHAQRHRGDQSGRLYLRARAHQGGRRDRALDHGAPFQHRALAFPARAPGRGDQMGAGRRRGQFPHRRIREAARPAHQDGRHHADVERARHRGAGEGGGQARACARHSGAGRRRAGRGASRRRRARHRLRLLRLHRPQALRADRDRRALRQIRSARRHAAVQRRRRDDPGRVAGPHHLWRAAAPLRGRHAGDRAGDRAWARRIDYVNSIGKPRIRAHEGALVKYAQERLGADQFAAHHRQCAGQGADRLVRDEGRASARCRHHHRPRRRRGARRHPLRDAAARALGLTATCRASFAHVQHQGRGGRRWPPR